MNKTRWFSAAIANFFLILTSLCPSIARAQDQHIDPKSIKHRHDLPITRHIDTVFGAQTAIAGANFASKALQICDRRVSADQDVSAAIAIDVVGAMTTFGTSGDGGNIVSDQAQMMGLLTDTPGKIKVVSQIRWCGRYPDPDEQFLGCASENSAIVIVHGLGVETTGIAIAHELGHVKGLGHRGEDDNPPLVGNPVMAAEGTHGTEVDLFETDKYHRGGQDDGPNRVIDHAIFVDTTGSMTEEIQGVKDSLISWVAAAPADLCRAFQLTTFKDSVVESVPTTDPMVIRSEIGSLSASGGDACPEASLEAINQVKDKIRDGGQIVIATDASPYSGAQLGPTIESLVGRSISVHVMLSGDCAASEFRSNDGKLLSEAPSGGVTSAVQVFSELAERTGGMFAYVPEVNESADGARRYGFVSYNLLQASSGPAVALASPGSIPVGASATVVFRGAHTNFRSGTILSVGGGGVAIEDVTARSALELVATLRVDAGATTGFRDVSITTGGEVALGAGSLQITAPVSLPTVTSITANSARPGETVRVTILGVNTHFGPESILNVGAGISVSAVQALSPSTLQATLAVSPLATVGFRDVRVTTGSEVASEALTGPFFVAPNPTGGVPTLTAVAPSSVTRGTTASLTLTGSNTSFVQGSSAVSFSGTGISVQSVMVQSPTQIVVSVVVAPTTPIGYQDVRVTTDTEVAAALNGILVSGGAPPGPATPVPGLSPMMLMLFAIALAIVASYVMRHGRRL